MRDIVVIIGIKTISTSIKIEMLSTMFVMSVNTVVGTMEEGMIMLIITMLTLTIKLEDMNMESILIISIIDLDPEINSKLQIDMAKKDDLIRNSRTDHKIIGKIA